MFLMQEIQVLFDFIITVKGGRLGPTLEGGEPDLKNLNVYCTPCDQDDIIVMMSDGVHDNLGMPANSYVILTIIRSPKPRINPKRM